MLRAVMGGVILALALAGQASGTTWVVPTEVPNLRDALAACANGDTVLVEDGTYSGPDNHNLTALQLDLVLRSRNGPASCTIDCEWQGEWLSVFDAEQPHDLLIEGFRVVHASSSAVYQVYGAVTIRNCEFDGNFKGLYPLGQKLGKLVIHLPGHALVAHGSRELFDQSKTGISRLEEHGPTVGAGIGEVKLGDDGAVKKLWKDKTRCRSLSGRRRASVCAKSRLNTAFLAREGLPVTQIRELCRLVTLCGRSQGLSMDTHDAHKHVPVMARKARPMSPIRPSAASSQLTSPVWLRLPDDARPPPFPL